MRDIYEEPFSLKVTIEIEPKIGVEVVQRGDHLVLECTAGAQNYDPRETIAYLADMIRRITQNDDELLWQVRHVLTQEVNGE